MKSYKYPPNLLTKEINYLHNEQSKTAKMEIEADARRWRDLPCSWIGRIILATLPKPVYKELHIRAPTQFFTEIEKQTNKNLKIHMETEKTLKV